MSTPTSASSSSGWGDDKSSKSAKAFSKGKKNDWWGSGKDDSNSLSMWWGGGKSGKSGSKCVKGKSSKMSGKAQDKWGGSEWASQFQYARYRSAGNDTMQGVGSRLYYYSMFGMMLLAIAGW